MEPQKGGQTKGAFERSHQKGIGAFLPWKNLYPRA